MFPCPTKESCIPKPFCKGDLWQGLVPHQAALFVMFFPELRDILHVPVLLPCVYPLTFFCLWSCLHWIGTFPRVWSDRWEKPEKHQFPENFRGKYLRSNKFSGNDRVCPKHGWQRTLQTTRESSPPWESREHEGRMVPAASALHWGPLVLAKWETHGDLLYKHSYADLKRSQRLPT